MGLNCLMVTGFAILGIRTNKVSLVLAMSVFPSNLFNTNSITPDFTVSHVSERIRLANDQSQVLLEIPYQKLHS